MTGREEQPMRWYMTLLMTFALFALLGLPRSVYACPA
jgi:hypothetical protein